MSLIGPEPFCGIGKFKYKNEFLEKEKAEREKLRLNLQQDPKDTWILVRNNYTSKWSRNEYSERYLKIFARMSRQKK